ncbi:MAG: hypothetical protein ACRD0A_07095 [Acidimicrobiales bacterium]
MSTPSRRDVVLLAVGLAIVVVSSIVASSGDVSAFETDVFHLINGLPDVLRGPMWVFQRPGLPLAPLAAAIVALVFRKWWLALALVVVIPLKPPSTRSPC